MLYLTARSGAHRGRSVPIGANGLVIGRAAQCDIVLDDPMVSRRHCEMVMEDGRLILRDLKSANTTLLNGQPTMEAVLEIGDEISVGRTVYLVTSMDAAPRASAQDVADDRTVSLRETDSIFTDGKVSALTAAGKPETIQDLAALFSLGRALSTVSTYDDLITTLANRLRERFEPEVCWMARVIGGTSDLSFIASEHAGLGTADSAPIAAMREAAGEHQARLLPPTGRNKNSDGFIMVAPVSVGGEVLAVIAIQSADKSRAFDQSDLEFFMAASHQAAPFFLSVEQVELLRRDNARLRMGANQTALVGESEAFKSMKRTLENAARSDLNVLVLGETGTGKELAARYIHDCSARAEAPFVAVNCAAIPQELLESELFGHEKGAFTGASRTHLGRFEQANQGTLFLDEIGDLSLPNQARILRAIENRVFHRLGAEKETQVDVRIVAATNKPLVRNVKNGEFRSDLYHRLNGFEITLPPLRERASDIPLLAEYFFQLARERAKHPVRSISEEALAYLQTCTWTGNIRELRSCIERAVHMAATDIIEKSDLQLPFDDVGGDAETLSLQEIERRHIARTLDKLKGNISAASRVLGVSRNTLYSKIEEYGLSQSRN